MNLYEIYDEIGRGSSDCGKVLLYVRSIMWDLGVPQSAATIAYEDNDACTAMANAQKPTARTRHIDTKDIMHFVNGLNVISLNLKESTHPRTWSITSPNN